MIKRDAEPFLWILFSAGGVVSAMLMPALLFLFGVAFPLGWLTPPDHLHMRALLANPLVAVVLLGLIVLSLFHWAHRFRHTLYDGLQIKHLEGVIVTVSYGGAIFGSAAAVYLLWQAR
jgi:fumarate reductase subunit D